MGNRLEESEITTGRIRGLQTIYPEAHEALINWGRWSRDLGGVYPKIASPSWPHSYRSPESWGDPPPEPSDHAKLTVVLRKAEPAEKEPYDERRASVLDERMHSAGGLSVTTRRFLQVAYVTVDMPEFQFPDKCGCSTDLFCESLEYALKFVGRFL